MNSCLTRFEGKQDGRVTMVICTKKDSSTFKRIVTPETCKICLAGTPPERLQEAHTATLEITPLGTLIYPRTTWEPPPCPPGYHKAHTEENWTFEPDSPVCKHLKLGTGVIGPCGYPRVKRRCKLVESFVGPKTCETCVKR